MNSDGATVLRSRVLERRKAVLARGVSDLVSRNSSPSKTPYVLMDEEQAGNLVHVVRRNLRKEGIDLRVTRRRNAEGRTTGRRTVTQDP